MLSAAFKGALSVSRQEKLQRLVLTLFVLFMVLSAGSILVWLIAHYFAGLARKLAH